MPPSLISSNRTDECRCIAITKQMPQAPTVTVETDRAATAAQLASALQAWNEAQVGPRNTEHFTLSIRGDDGELLGGLVGEIFWNALYVSILWIKDGHRGSGYGSALMNRAEEIARKRLCDVVFLTSMSFQAPGFYEKCGYTRFAELNAAPQGFSRIWFAKQLR
jgi:ribosomal protein S18 acetylase RimI-like enzyme